MDFGIYLILCGGVLVLGVIGFVLRIALASLLGFFLGLVTMIQAVIDNQFIVQVAYSAGFQNNTTSIYPAIYLVMFLMLLDGILTVSKRRNLV